MPVTCSVTALAREHIGSAGEYLRAVKAGRCEPAELVAVAVDAGGTVAIDDASDSALGVSAADVAACAQLTGKAGLTASMVAKVGDNLLRVVFVGVAGRTASELRRAGGELARLVRPGEEAVADIAAAPVAGQLARLTAASRPHPIGSSIGTKSAAALTWSSNSPIGAVSGSRCATFCP